MRNYALRSAAIGRILCLFSISVPFALLVAQANVPPTPMVLSAAQRPGTTFMDVDFRVNDPDDATVEVYALGFVNGGTNLSEIIKVSTLEEGTAANLGANVPANTNLHLTWNVGADWNTNFGNVQVEILAKDGRGLLPFHWITIPANGANPAITVSEKNLTDTNFLALWYWLLATNHPGIVLSNGIIYGTTGDYAGKHLAQGTNTAAFGRDFLCQHLDIRNLSGGEPNRIGAGRFGLASTSVDYLIYSVAKGWSNPPPDRIYGWGDNLNGKADIKVNQRNITGVAVGMISTLILSEGRVTGWGQNIGQAIPDSATNLTAVAAGSFHSLALRADGNVVGWGMNNKGQIDIPPSATNVVAIAAGGLFNEGEYSMALRADGTVVAWGDNTCGQLNIPASATNVMAIAAAGSGCHSLALRSNGTVVAWGYSFSNTNVPASATNVTAIAAGYDHSLALRANGTVVGWGENYNGQTTIPATATNIVAISAGMGHSAALRADGTVIAWGSSGLTNVPPGVDSIDLLGIGGTAYHMIAVDKVNP